MARMSAASGSETTQVKRHPDAAAMELQLQPTVEINP
jgi:hypothetical protein